MELIQKWFERQFRGDNRRSSLEEALLGFRPWRYIWYRQQYLVLSQIFLFFLLLLEINFLYPVFAQRKIASSLLVYNVTHLLLWFWWGGLEVFRDRVRNFSSLGKHTELQQELQKWINLSLIIGFSLAAAALSYFIYYIVFGPADQRLFHAFMAILIIRLAMQIPTRTIYSGILAITRVYRPVYSIMFADVFYLLTIIIFWHFLHVWAFLAAMLFSSAVSTAVTNYYCIRAYRLMKIPLSNFGLRIKTGLLSQIFSKKFFLAGFAFASARLGNFFVLILLFQQITPNTKMLLFAQALSPLINAGAGWSQLFYFDFKKLHSRLLKSFQDRLVKKLLIISQVVGVIVWLLSSTIMITLFGIRNTEILLGVLLALLLRSALCVYHVSFFTGGYFLSMISSFALTIFVLLFEQRLPWIGGLNGIWQICFALFLTIVYLETTPKLFTKLQQKIWPHRALAASPANIIEWLGALKKIRHPVQIGKFVFHKEQNWPIRKIIADIQGQIGAKGAAIAMGKSQVFWYHIDEKIDANSLIIHFGGIVSEFTQTEMLQSGREGVDFLIDKEWLGPVSPSETTSTKKLIADFQLLFADGLVIIPKQIISRSAQPISRLDKRNIIKDAMRFCSLTSASGRKTKLDVSASCEGDIIQAIFALPRKPSTSEHRNEWKRRLRNLNLLNYFHSA